MGAEWLGVHRAVGGHQEARRAQGSEETAEQPGVISGRLRSNGSVGCAS